MNNSNQQGALKTMSPMIEGKPNRPLSAYNLFFKMERQRILEDKVDQPITLQDLKQIRSQHHQLKGKRLHRKTHGKISFRELSKMVAKRWKELDAGVRELFYTEAQDEKKEYEKRHTAWMSRTGFEKEYLTLFGTPISMERRGDAAVFADLNQLGALHAHIEFQMSLLLLENSQPPEISRESQQHQCEQQEEATFVSPLPSVSCSSSFVWQEPMGQDPLESFAHEWHLEGLETCDIDDIF